MFENLISFESISIKNFDTNNVEDISYLFNNCSSLKEVDLTNLATSKVINMESMFANCINIKELDFSSFNTSHCSYFYEIFDGCNESLTVIFRNKTNNEELIEFIGDDVNIKYLEK